MVEEAAREVFIVQRAGGDGHRCYPILNMWFFWPRRRGALADGHVEMLLLFDNVGQNRTETFVLNNRSLVDLRALVEGAVGQIEAVVPDGQPPVGIIDHRDPLARQRPRDRVRFQHEHDLVVLQCQIDRHRTLFLPGEGIVEIVMVGKRTMDITIIEWRLGKARIIRLHEDGQKCIAGLRWRRCHIGASPSPAGPAAWPWARSTRPLGLRGVGADDIDVQRMQSPAELRHAIAGGRILPVDPEHAVLVGVERHRLAITLEVSTRRCKIIEGALALDKLQMHQPAGGIIDIDEQGALWPTPLEPPVFRTVDLDQLAQAVAPIPWLVHRLEPCATVLHRPATIIHCRRVSRPR